MNTTEIERLAEAVGWLAEDARLWADRAAEAVIEAETWGRRLPANHPRQQHLAENVTDCADRARVAAAEAVAAGAALERARAPRPVASADEEAVWVEDFCPRCGNEADHDLDGCTVECWACWATGFDRQGPPGDWSRHDTSCRSCGGDGQVPLVGELPSQEAGEARYAGELAQWGITFDELIEGIDAGLHCYVYVDGRVNGRGHEELLEIGRRCPMMHVRTLRSLSWEADSGGVRPAGPMGVPWPEAMGR